MPDTTRDGIPIAAQTESFACPEPSCKLLHVAFRDKEGRALCVASFNSEMLMEMNKLHREIVRDKSGD
jgi:hypothetical protein